MGCFGLSAVLTLGIYANPAYADDVFDLNGQSWKSIQSYEDTLKSDKPSAEPSSSASPVTNPPQMQPAASMPPSQEEPAPKMSPATPSSTASIAPPQRPISLPVLPVFNRQYDVQVQSTADEPSSTAAAAHIVNMDTTPEFHLKDQNWQNATDVATQKPNEEDSDEQKKPLHIRYSSLPNAQIKPVPFIPKGLTHGHPPKAPDTASTQLAETPKKPDLAACAAVDAYKKKQLQALQSDRKTLEALQSAIAQLGLQKQLSFMTDTQGSLNLQQLPTNKPE